MLIKSLNNPTKFLAAVQSKLRSGALHVVAQTRRAVAGPMVTEGTVDHPDSVQHYTDDEVISMVNDTEVHDDPGADGVFHDDEDDLDDDEYEDDEGYDYPVDHKRPADQE